MNKFLEKARAVLKLLEGYCLRVVKVINLVGTTLNFLHAESYEMQNVTEQLYLQALAELESVERAIKDVKNQIVKKDGQEEE